MVVQVGRHLFRILAVTLHPQRQGFESLHQLEGTLCRQGSPGISQGNYAGTGVGLGYSFGAEGNLSPRGYEFESGVSGTIGTLLLLPDDADRLLVADSEDPSALEGLWLKVADHLAVELDAGQPDTILGGRFWLIDIPEGSLTWSDGDSVEVSLWEEEPPLSEPPPRQLWTSALTVGSDDYGHGFGTGVGFGEQVVGRMDPAAYEYAPGSTALFVRLLVLTDDDDRLYVRAASGASGLEGLWLKVADHLAVELGEPSGPDNGFWFFDIGEGSLLWESGDEVEVSLWDKEPPLSEPPPRRLWTSTLTPSAETFDPEGQGYGWVEAGAGLLSPWEYEYESGSTVTIDWLVHFTDRDVLRLSSFMNVDALDGLWLKLGSGVALEMDAASRSAGQAAREWSIAPGTLDWSGGGAVEVSLWDSQPPGTTVPEPAPRQLWSATLTAGREQHLGQWSVGFATGGAQGSLSPSSHEFEPGSTTTIDWLVVWEDDDVLSLVSYQNHDALDGLWLRIGADRVFEMDAAARTTADTQWDWSPDPVLEWSSGDTIEVSLWDRDPS